MSFRIAAFQASLFASLVFALLPAANAQSTGGGQRLIFSSPDGQVSSNAPIPMIQAPQPRQTPNAPAGQVVVREFSDPLVAPAYPVLPPVLRQRDSQNQDDFQDSMNVRKQMGSLTPGQIMDVPTVEQIFGLPEKKALAARKEPWQLDSENGDNGPTNEVTFGTNSLFAEPSWAKLWTDNQGKSPGSSNTTERASGFFSRFFDSPRNDNVFGNHTANGDETFLGPSHSAPQQSSWDSGFASGALTPPPATSASANDFTTPAASPALASQSPFTPPQVSTLDNMPKLPSLPSLPGQNSHLTQPASTPAWTPKPPPWTQPQTPFGTPVPANPALQR